MTLARNMKHWPQTLIRSSHRNRCNNLRLRGFPESITDLIHNVIQLFKSLLPECESVAFTCDRIHRALLPKPPANKPPRDIILCMQDFLVKEEILQGTSRRSLWMTSQSRSIRTFHLPLLTDAEAWRKSPPHCKLPKSNTEGDSPLNRWSLIMALHMLSQHSWRARRFWWNWAYWKLKPCATHPWPPGLHRYGTHLLPDGTDGELDTTKLPLRI